MAEIELKARRGEPVVRTGMTATLCGLTAWVAATTLPGVLVAARGAPTV